MLHTLVLSMRLPFLILTPVSIFLGYATSMVSTLQIEYVDLFLVLVGALLAHISVNLLDELHDFDRHLSGTIRRTDNRAGNHSGNRSGNHRAMRTAFSTSSGALLDHPDAVAMARYGAWGSLAITTLIGSYFASRHGLRILPLGLIGVLIIVSHARRLSQHPGAGLIAPGIAFGPLMVMGTHVVLSGEYSIQAGVASLVPFFLTINLLLLNQYPDIAADRHMGRHHFPIVYGERMGILLYGNTLMASCGVIVLAILSGIFPGLSIVCLFPMGVAVTIFFSIARRGISLGRLLPLLRMNVGVTIMTSAFLGLSIIYA